MSEDENGMGYRQPRNAITQPGIRVKREEEYILPFNRRNYGEDEYGNEGRYQPSQLDSEIKDIDEEQLSMRFGNPDNLLEILANHARSKNTRRGSRYLANPELIGEEEQGAGYSKGIGYEQEEEDISRNEIEVIKHEKLDEILEPVKDEMLEPVKDEIIEPAKDEKLETVKHEKLEQVNHEKLEPIKHEKLEPIKPELEESYQSNKIEQYQHHKTDTFKYEEPKMSFSKSQDTPPSITLSINPSTIHPSPSILSPKSPNFEEIPTDLSISHPQSHSNLSSKDFSTSAHRSQSSSDSEPESSHPTNPSTISNIEQSISKPLSDQDSSSDEEPIAPVSPPSLHISGPRGTLAGLLPNSNSKSDMIDRNMQKSGLVISERTSNCASCSVF